MEKNQEIKIELNGEQKELTIRNGEAPQQLDKLAPVKIDINGTIQAPLRFLEKRVGDIDQHKAHILVNRDKLAIHLVYAENDPYEQGNITGKLCLSEIFQKLGINTSKQWQPEQLGQFLKLNRTYFASRDENNRVVNALKSFNADVNQKVQRETNEKGNRAMTFRQAVDSNIPESFKLNIPIFSGGKIEEIEVETYASIDGTDITIALQSAGAVDAIEKVKQIEFDSIIKDIENVAPNIVIIEQ